ncbi:MAG: ABC transporter permease [Pseudomonadota bacterium]|nr:ABC transporter permease [Pseudomonadota bacterium]
MSDHRPSLERTLTAAGCVLKLRGRWCIEHLEQIDRLLAETPTPHDCHVCVDAGKLVDIDSTGVMLLVNRLRAQGVVWPHVELVAFNEHQLTLIHLVANRLDARARPRSRRRALLPLLGRKATQWATGLVGHFAFFGHIVEGFYEVIRRPRLLRLRECTAQLEAVGPNALPIVGLMTLLIGVVFAFLLSVQVRKFGANIFIVDGVTIAIARELAPLLTAVLVAGRSGAAFTAQIGAMRVTEEIDAITTLGLSPVQVLVLPRLLAIIVALPLLTFVGDVMGVLGAAWVANAQLDITYYTFFERMKSVSPINMVLFGLYKTPVFAAAIALIACRNGFVVSRDARSVGEYTTRTVVQSIVAVILIDSAFAIAFPEITQ